MAKRKKAEGVGEYEITDDVPVPILSARYPIKDLEPGQSFSVPSEEGGRIRGAISGYRKKMKEAGEEMKFSVRTDPNDEERVRVWRIE
mgnify:CR=1 FL=1